MSLPNFFIVGAAKAGTTALHYYLKQHPHICMSAQKEPKFFAFEGQQAKFNGPGGDQFSRSIITDLEEYQQQFRVASTETAIGEASPWYLYSDQAAKNIYRRLPDAKLIVVLRNPVDRAFSSYLHVVSDGREYLSFEEGLRAEEERIAAGWEFIWHYRRAGFYAEQISHFLNFFPREQMRFYLYDDLYADSTSLLKDIYEFLEVDHSFMADTSVRPNSTGVPKNKMLTQLLFRPNPLKTVARALLPQDLKYSISQRLRTKSLLKPQVANDTRRELLSDYREDILALQGLIDRDLSLWIEE